MVEDERKSLDGRDIVIKHLQQENVDLRNTLKEIYKYLTESDNNNMLILKGKKGYNSEGWCDYYCKLVCNIDKRIKKSLAPNTGSGKG